MVSAAGVRLPVLARDHNGAILSFSDLFQPHPEESTAKSPKPARQAVNAARRKMRVATAIDAKRGGKAECIHEANHDQECVTNAALQVTVSSGTQIGIE